MKRKKEILNIEFLENEIRDIQKIRVVPIKEKESLVLSELGYIYVDMSLPILDNIINAIS